MIAAALVLLCGQAYPDEEVYDTRVHDGEALVNVALVNHRWPDCTSNRSAVADMFRIEGARTDVEKAMALWKWFRLLMNPRGGGYRYEGPVPGKEDFVRDPHKLFTVYGSHQCDTGSFAFTALWRAAGYVAYDQVAWMKLESYDAPLFHTISSLRYRDDDGRMRFHDFDPQYWRYYWDPRGHVGTLTVPTIRRAVHRHLLAPQQVHTLRTSLRAGERLERVWANEGRIIPGLKPEKVVDFSRDPSYGWRPGRRDHTYAVAGEELQTFEAGPSEGEVVHRIASPYVATAATCEAELGKGGRLSLSWDGATWRPIAEGEGAKVVDLGREARAADRPHVYTAYAFFLKAEGEVKRLKVSVARELNFRTLPNLMPGENVFRVTADRLGPGLALALELEYVVDGRPRTERRLVRRFPHYFRIDAPAVERVYDAAKMDPAAGDFFDDRLRMKAIRMRLVADGPESASLPEAEAVAKFGAPCPHPARLENRIEAPAAATDPAQVSGFFPQGPGTAEQRRPMEALVEIVKTGKPAEKWAALEDLGLHPGALDFLIAQLERSNIDETVFICKALARIGDRRAVPALLKYWSKGPPSWTPGSRYVPDALAAIGDPSVVPALAGRLPSCRFDVRLHVARALGILGGRQARAALEDLAANDPFPAVREEAREALKRKP